MTVSDETLTLRKSMNMRASLESLAFSHSKTAISFQVTNYNLHDTYITNAVPCYYLWYGVIYTNDSIPTKN